MVVSKGIVIRSIVYPWMKLIQTTNLGHARGNGMWVGF